MPKSTVEALAGMERFVYDYGKHLCDVLNEANKGYSFCPAQALIILRWYSDRLTVGNVETIYCGQNVSYNVKDLCEVGLLNRERGIMDKRTFVLSLTDRGKEMQKLLREAHDMYIMRRPAVEIFGESMVNSR